MSDTVTVLGVKMSKTYESYDGVVWKPIEVQNTDTRIECLFSDEYGGLSLSFRYFDNVQTVNLYSDKFISDEEILSRINDNVKHMEAHLQKARESTQISRLIREFALDTVLDQLNKQTEDGNAPTERISR